MPQEFWFKYIGFFLYWRPKHRQKDTHTLVVPEMVTCLCDSHADYQASRFHTCICHLFMCIINLHVPYMGNDQCWVRLGQMLACAI